MSYSGQSCVLVGFDGSAASQQALRWGAEEARLRCLPLTICHTWNRSYPAASGRAVLLATMRELGQELLGKGTMIAHQFAPQIKVRTRLAAGPASAILVERSGEAALVVVGAHGQNGSGEFAAGSTAVQVATYGHCPVLVARGAADRNRPVVVGVDGSPESEAALAFGFEEAALRRQPLIAVHACGETEARTSLVTRTPLQALLGLAGGSGLLVLGDRGRGGAVASRCLSCGNCTMVCPTCFCTTVEDVTDLTGEHAERWQRWDSCFDLDFSHLPSGSVRASGKSRYRQWLTHKLGTWHDQFGSSGCVGCGRCIVWCPVGIDLTEEVAALREEKNE
jgi:nucleotide-binding universal stress UspA family protein/Pyruvate/2-oxoacid:ferredoxin oxidoreductase delta subunit